MLSVVAGLFLLLLGVCAFRYAWALRRNVLLARATGLPYVVLPFHNHSRRWEIASPFIFPLLARLPKAWTTPQLTFISSNWAWKARYAPYRALGSDSILLVSAARLVLTTCAADVTDQVVTRRNDFPKALMLYGALDVFGPNLVTTEGAVWRRQRRILAPSFNEKNNELVWGESLRQARAMLRVWLGGSGGGGEAGTVHDVSEASLRLTLHVISRAGFGMELSWPQEAGHAAAGAGTSAAAPPAGKAGDGIAPGHSMSFFDALHVLLTKILWVLLVPRIILRYSPSKVMRLALHAYEESYRYMVELYEGKRNEPSHKESGKDFDLMGAMARATKDEASDQSKRSLESLKRDSTKENTSLSFTEVMGNAFIFVLAGHETSGNTVHFALVHLAMYPASQARLQEELDEIFGDRPASEWSYDDDFPKLQDSLAAAFMYETLRLKPPALEIIKLVGAEPQPLAIDGRTVMIPPKTIIACNVVASQLNARNWPTAGSDGDLEEFRAERWLVDNLAASASPAPSTTAASEEEDEYAPTQRRQQRQQQQQHGHSGPHAMYRPRRGAFIPFSEGARGCLGRRFATVEILAVLALILRDYSVELAVHEYAADDEVERMPAGSAARRAVWDKARARAQWLLTKGMATTITLQMVKGRVPLRVVKRGRERFRFSD